MSTALTTRTTGGGTQAPLTELVCEINRLHAEVLAVDLVGLERALHIGKLLNDLYATDLSTQEMRGYTAQLTLHSHTQRRYRKIAQHASSVASCSSIEDAEALIRQQELPFEPASKNRARKVTREQAQAMVERTAAGESRRSVARDMGVGTYTVTRHVAPDAYVAQRIQKTSYAQRKALAAAALLEADIAAQAENIATLVRLLDEAQTLARRIGREAESRAFKHAMKDCAREVGRARRAATRRAES